jgi:hypothetical protein
MQSSLLALPMGFGRSSGAHLQSLVISWSTRFSGMGAYGLQVIFVSGSIRTIGKPHCCRRTLGESRKRLRFLPRSKGLTNSVLVNVESVADHGSSNGREHHYTSTWTRAGPEAKPTLQEREESWSAWSWVRKSLTQIHSPRPPISLESNIYSRLQIGSDLIIGPFGPTTAFLDGSSKPKPILPATSLRSATSCFIPYRLRNRATGNAGVLLPCYRYPRIHNCVFFPLSPCAPYGPELPARGNHQNEKRGWPPREAASPNTKESPST